MKANVKVTSELVAKLREDAGLNQRDFWTPIGVTQSGGSRYEAGRTIPKPVQKLVAAVYITKDLGDDAMKRINKLVR